MEQRKPIGSPNGAVSRIAQLQQAEPAAARSGYSTTDEQRLHGNIHTDESWERATVDQEWWRAQSLFFPAPPIKGTEFLFPVSSFESLVNEYKKMGIPLDNFWVRSVLSPSWRMAYFFKWSAEVSALVLAVFDRTHRELTHIECLAEGDKPVPMPHRSEVLTSVINAFASVDFGTKRAEKVARKASLN